MDIFGKDLISAEICSIYLQQKKFKGDCGKLILGKDGKSGQEYLMELSVYQLFNGFV